MVLESHMQIRFGKETRKKNLVYGTSLTKSQKCNLALIFDFIKYKSGCFITGLPNILLIFSMI